MISLRVSWKGGLALAFMISLVATASGADLPFVVNGESFAMSRFPDNAGTVRRPVVLLLHGVDGLSEFSRPQILGFAEEVAKAGFVVFVPTYFGASDGRVDGFPKPADIAARISRVDQYGPRVAKAVEVARSQPDADPDRVGLVGFSLGGGLALERAEASAGEIKAVVDFFGYIGSNTIGDNVAKLPPTLVLHNPKDQIVDVAISKRLLGALNMTKVVHESHFLDDENPTAMYHPFRAGGSADKQSRELTLKWLVKYLKP